MATLLDSVSKVMPIHWKKSKTNSFSPKGFSITKFLSRSVACSFNKPAEKFWQQTKTKKIYCSDSKIISNLSQNKSSNFSTGHIECSSGSPAEFFPINVLQDFTQGQKLVMNSHFVCFLNVVLDNRLQFLQPC